ncbi:hypothetical protein [Mesorhizobium sp. f-mel]
MELGKVDAKELAAYCGEDLLDDAGAIHAFPAAMPIGNMVLTL